MALIGDTAAKSGVIFCQPAIETLAHHAAEVVDLAAEVEDSVDRDRAAIEVQDPSRSPHRSITAVRAADDTDAFGVGDPFRNGPAHPVGNIVLHGEAKLSLAGLFKGHSLSRSIRGNWAEEQRSRVRREIGSIIVA